MAIIKFSPDILRGSANTVQGYMVNYINQVIGSPTLGFGATFGWWSAGNQTNFNNTANYGLMRIMSGTRPTNIESLTTTTPPAGTTVLWERLSYIFGQPDPWAPTGNNWYTNPTVISSSFAATIATGAATWFWIATINAGRMVIPNPTGVSHNITGDIGTVGSGSDMEMLNTSIVTGQFLRVINLNIGIPTGFFT